MRKAVFLALALLLTGSGAATAQSWPDRPVKIVVAFTPGGSIDAFARALAPHFQQKFGQPFIIENKPGAGGTMATEQVSRAAPDGYTLTVHSSTIASMGPVMKTDFDASVNLTPVAMLARGPVAILVPTPSPVKSVKDLVEQSKANPGKLLYGSAGIGSTNHLQTELFNKRAGTSLKHVPYKGIAQALQDLGGDRLHVLFGSLGSASGLMQSGHLRVVGYAGDERAVGYPDAPSIKSAGIDYEVSIWWGFFAPPGLPSEIRGKLHEVINTALRDPAFIKLVESAGAVPAPMTSEQFAAVVKKEVAETREVVEAAKIVFE
jgi:tripartite-type tricarboxylate transporter receptor subunit TctC